MTEAAPWWGVPVIAGAFLIIGGVLTFLYTIYHDWRKARRENAEKWQDKLFEVVVEILGLYVHMQRFFVHDGPYIAQNIGGDSNQDALRLTSELWLLDRGGHLYPAGAKCLESAVQVLGVAIGGQEGGGADPREKLIEASLDYYETFIQTARKELGIR